MTIDAQRMTPKIRPGGFLGEDNFSESPWRREARREPTLVFPYTVFFAEATSPPIAFSAPAST